MRSLTSIAALSFIILFAVSCSTAKKAATNKNKGTIACADKQLVGPHFDWRIESEEVLKGYTAKPLPKAYKVYSIDSEQLANFFMVAGSNMRDMPPLNTLIPLPDPTGCQQFELSFANKKTIPGKADMVLLKGKGVDTKQNSVSIGYDGEKMFANLACGASSYTVTQVVNNSKPYYIVAQLPDNNTPKVPQAPAAPQVQGKTYDR